MGQDELNQKSVSLMQMDLQEALEFLTGQSQTLWRVHTFERLIQRFSQIFKDHLHLKSLSVLSLMVKNKFEWQELELKIKDLDHVDDGIIKQMQTDFSYQQLKQPQIRSGLHSYQNAKQNVYFALLGEPLSQWYIVVMAFDNNLQKKHSQLHYYYCNYFVRQLQAEKDWLSRLDKTQALLYRDDLTGVFNNRYLDVALDNEIKRAQRLQTNFCLLFIDLDNFKNINDKFGHLSGSSVLKQVADVLLETLREIDSIIRYGGDEFIVILLGANTITGYAAGERLRKRVENSVFRVEGNIPVHLTASIGVASYPEHALDKQKLVQLADASMYKSKRSGKNSVMIMDDQDELLLNSLEKE